MEAVEVHHCSMPSKGLHVSFTNAGGDATLRDREELPKTIDAPTRLGKSWADIVLQELDASLSKRKHKADMNMISEHQYIHTIPNTTTNIRPILKIAFLGACPGGAT